jgi:hypothetical protein
LLINVTTPALKTRLTEQAREHERLAEAVEIGEKPMPAVFEPGNGRRLTLRL